MAELFDLTDARMALLIGTPAAGRLCEGSQPTRWIAAVRIEPDAHARASLWRRCTVSARSTTGAHLRDGIVRTLAAAADRVADAEAHKQALADVDAIYRGFPKAAIPRGGSLLFVLDGDSTVSLQFDVRFRAQLCSPCLCRDGRVTVVFGVRRDAAVRRPRDASVYAFALALYDTLCWRPTWANRPRALRCGGRHGCQLIA